MRSFAVLAIAGFLLIALAPAVSATATPVLVWPALDFVPREAAGNLTGWAAGRLGLTVDPAGTPGWSAVDLPLTPQFAAPRERYTLPVLDGNVTAWYTGDGKLHSIGVSGDTPYIAPSVDLRDLEGVATQVAVALDLVIDFTGAGVGIPGPALPPDERFWILSVSSARLEPGGDFYFAGATFRETDRRLVGFSASAWYRADGVPDLTGPDAAEAAFAFARAAYNASGPSGDLGMPYVVNGSGFAYGVNVFWPSASPDLGWFLRVWLDANTGEAIEVEGPRLQPRPIENGVSRLPAEVILAGVLVGVAALLAVLFFRLSAARALDHFTRGQIYGFVAANPGIHYSAVRGALGLPNGTLEYHLWVLQRSGYLRSVREGRFRRLFAEGVGSRHGSVVLSRLQYSILDLIHASGPLPKAEIARTLGLSRQRGHYNLKVLIALSLVEATADGRVRLSPGGAEFISETRVPRRTPDPAPG